MKIIHILPDLSYGGAEKACIQLCNYQAQFHEVYLICLSDHTHEMFRLEYLDARVKLITLSKFSGFDKKLFTRLYRILKSLNPAVINAHMGCLIYAALYIILQRRVKVFYTVHSFVRRNTHKRHRIFYKILFKIRKVTLVPNSHAVWETSRRCYKKEGNGYIHLGIEGMKMSDEHSKVCREIENYKLNKETKVLVAIARITPIKNQLLLLQAYLQLIREEFDAILLIIGKAMDERYFLQLQGFKHPGIHFLGKKDNIADYLSVADAFCLTSKYEGLSLSTIEAMSMKVIPVCTPAGGVTEVVQDGYNGFLSCGHTVEAYVEALKRCLSLDDLSRETMRENAFRTYQEHFTIERCGEAYLNLYKNAFLDVSGVGQRGRWRKKMPDQKKDSVSGSV